MAGPLPTPGQNLPPGLGVPSHLQQLFQKVDQPDTPTPPFSHQAANQYGPTVKKIAKGSLVYFRYMNYQHDPYPLVIITDIWPNHVRGINLHYLTFNYIKRLLNMHCENQMFSYLNIKGNEYITNAFRSYKRLGMKQLKALDCSFLLNVLGQVISFDPAEVEQMKVYVRDQLQRQANPKAESMQEKYMGMHKGQQDQGFAQPLKTPLSPPGDMPGGLA